jgi:hypothetical protein
MPTRRISGTATAASDPDNGGDHSGGGGSGGTFVDDVFSTYLYTGTDADQDIVNGIDLDGEGGMVWTKDRTAGYDHGLMDTERGVSGGNLQSNEAFGAQVAPAGKDLTSFNSNGYSVGPKYTGSYNSSGVGYVSWTFRKAPSFFDVVTYTGDGVTGREIPHNLGVEPGMIIVKRTDGTGKWPVWNRSISTGTTARLLLEDRAEAQLQAETFTSTSPTSSAFTVGSHSDVNTLNSEYVAYVFAHDDSEEGVIQCGSYTGNGNADGPEIDLGWEPQWLLLKPASSSGDWVLRDNMRGWPVGANFPKLSANLSDAESANTARLDITPTGFKVNDTTSSVNASNGEYIYMAIRRPNKPASEFEPEELFALSNQVSTEPNYVSGFPADALLRSVITGGANYPMLMARLTQGSTLVTSDPGTGMESSAFAFDYQDGAMSNGSDSLDYVGAMWRRAHGFFDVVTYEGTGVAGLQVPHSLGVKPEMMWVKCKNGNGDWAVYSDSVALDGKLNSVATFGFRLFNEPTDEVFEIKNGPDNDLNAGRTVFHIAYLFASVPGICDIGTYTGTGSNVVVDCGFGAAIPRFVMVKRTDGNGNWMYTDFPGGLNRTLALNTTDAQKDKRFSYTSGAFTVLPVTTDGDTWNPSIDGAEYIYMAIA